MLTKLLASINNSLKAHSAGLGAAVTLLLADLDSGNAITGHQWIAIAGAYLGLTGIVHIIPNVPKAAVANIADSAVEDTVYAATDADK